MRKWQDLAAPDDPGSWYGIGNMWPTGRGSYATADGSAGTNYGSSVVSNNVSYAYFLRKNNEFVFLHEGGSAAVRFWNGTTWTLLTVAGGAPAAGVRGGVCLTGVNSTDVVLAPGSTLKLHLSVNGGNFTEIAGSPTGKNIVFVQSSCVIAMATNSNVVHTSDVGDFTNWVTGEAHNRTLYNFPQLPTAGLSFGAHAYIYKPASIERMTYVGGDEKWIVETAWTGMGIPNEPTGTIAWPTQDWVVATSRGMAFYGGNGRIYLFDGTSPPVCLNPLTTIPVERTLPVFSYDPRTDRLCLAPSFGSDEDGQSNPGGVTIDSRYYYYNFETGMWGDGFGSADEIGASAASVSGPLRGTNWQVAYGSTKPPFWYAEAGVSGFVRRCAFDSSSDPNDCYLETTKVGESSRKTDFTRLIPQLRSLADDWSGGSLDPLVFSLFREREDTTAVETRSVNPSSERQRFDLRDGVFTDNFARFKVTWRVLRVDVDDFVVVSTPGAED